MSPPTAARFLIALLVFSLLVLMAFPAGLPRQGEGDTRELQVSLEGMKKTMEENAVFHSAGKPTSFTATAAFCGECHPMPPHPGAGTAPAFFNQHVTFLDCLVCHWAKVSGSQPDLAWDRSPGEDGEGGLVLRVADPLEGGPRDLSVLRSSVIKRQTCFDRGIFCAECHRPGGMDRYASPGMKPEVVEYLEALPDIFLLPKGKKWYFPQRQ